MDAVITMTTQPIRNSYGEVRWHGRRQSDGRNAYDIRDGWTILATVAPDHAGGWDAFVNGDHIGHARLKVDAQYIAEAILEDGTS